MLNAGESKSSLYYSLNFPTLLEGSPLDKNPTTFMLQLKEIKLMIETFLRDFSTENYLLLENQFQYFHVEQDKQSEVALNTILPH
jgi:hypothetical protein